MQRFNIPSMAEVPADPHRYGANQYFALADCGLIAPDDRTELLDGIIVAMSPPSPAHDAAVELVHHVLLKKLGIDAIIRVQMTFAAGTLSVPEPDIAIVPGDRRDYFSRHPSVANLIVEVAQSSLIQDRITKAAIYAAAGVSCYWIVNLRDRCIEVFREPDPGEGAYRMVSRHTGPETLTIDAYAGVVFTAEELLPPAGAFY